MNVADLALPRELALLGWILALPLAAWAGWRTDWSRLARTEAVNALFGGALLVVVLWSLRGQVGDAFAFHLLGCAGLTLAVGLPAALCGGALVVAITTLLRDAPIANAALVWLTLVALPATTVGAWHALLDRRLPANLFVYIFGSCFAGGVLSMIAAGAAGAAVAFTSGVSSGLSIGDYVPLFLSLGFAEGTLIGMVLTIAVVYRPGWVATFDDARHLGR